MWDKLKGVAILILVVVAPMTGCGLVHVTEKTLMPETPHAKTNLVQMIQTRPIPETDVPRSKMAWVRSPEANGESAASATRVDIAPSNGSLWKENDSRSFFFLDAKAGFVGDIVTVRVIENASGSKGAKTSTARTSSIAASTASLFGLPSDHLAKAGIGSDFTNSFDGDGSTSRSGSLTADVTAIVTKVYPNGNMEIAGRREVTINNEKEYLSISGIIRPEDIGPGNTVLSTVIADAKIEYSGLGVINDKQRPGWLMRLIDFIWPF